MNPSESIRWYRTPVEKEVLRELTRRSDWKGLLQSGGFLSIMVLTAVLVFWSVNVWPWLITAALLFVHGTVCAFCVNAMHELSHTTVFNNKALNGFFLYLFSFIGWINPVVFKASHTKHHHFTLYPPRDLEVLPDGYPAASTFLRTFIDPVGFAKLLGATCRHAAGKLNSPWEKSLFPSAESRKPIVSWARILLAGHLLILIGSALAGWWMVPVVVSLTPLYGRWLQFLCNETQHTGLPGNIPDWRVCARSVQLNPLLGFVYWHMQYHIEHHMYASVPCYNLRKLYKAIKQDVPRRAGLVGTWRDLLKR